jgi:hypothetical protein
MKSIQTTISKGHNPLKTSGKVYQPISSEVKLHVKRNMGAKVEVLSVVSADGVEQILGLIH